MMENTAETSPRIEITLTKGPFATIAVVYLLDNIGETEAIFTGEARRHPRDQENRQIGDMYALGRAFRSLSDDMLGWADDAVDSASKAQTAGAIMHDLLKSVLDA